MPFTDLSYTFETTREGGAVVIHEPGESPYRINAESLKRRIINLRDYAAQYSAEEYQSLMELYRSALAHLERVTS
jgi:hypothetical protein